MKKPMLIVILFFLANIALLLWMEGTHRADSLGMWYTIYSATLYTIPILIIVIVFQIARNNLRKRKGSATHMQDAEGKK